MTAWPVATSQSLTLPSADPEATVLPSGENATDQTQDSCSSKVAAVDPVATSQSLTV